MTVLQLKHTNAELCAKTLPSQLTIAKPQNVVAFPTSAEHKLRKLKVRLDYEAKALEQEQNLTDELRLQYTQTQFYIYFEGARSILNNFIASSNAQAFKFVLLYIIHETRQRPINFKHICQFYLQISTRPLFLNTSLLRDFFRARDLIIRQSFNREIVNQAIEICRILEVSFLAEQ